MIKRMLSISILVISSALFIVITARTSLAQVDCSLIKQAIKELNNKVALGNPGPCSATMGNTGVKLQLDHSVIYALSGHLTAVCGGAFEKYRELLFEKSALGYPKDSDLETICANQSVVHFQNGIIVYDADGNAVPLFGEVAKAYIAQRGVTGDLGRPEGVSMATLDGNGSVTEFENGWIDFHERAGAFIWHRSKTYKAWLDVNGSISYSRNGTIDRFDISSFRVEINPMTFIVIAPCDAKFSARRHSGIGLSGVSYINEQGLLILYLRLTRFVYDASAGTCEEDSESEFFKGDYLIIPSNDGTEIRNVPRQSIGGESSVQFESLEFDYSARN